MNGWNGIANLGSFNTGPGNWPGFGVPMPPISAAPYMTPAGGYEVMNPQRGMSLNPLQTSVPGTIGGGSGGWFGIDGLGKNLDTLRTGVGVLGGIASIWNASQQNKLAKASFNHQRGILDTNLANQIKSYNLSVDDKFRSRAVVEGRTDAQRDADIAKWSARDERRRG